MQHTPFFIRSPTDHCKHPQKIFSQAQGNRAPLSFPKPTHTQAYPRLQAALKGFISLIGFYAVMLHCCTAAARPTNVPESTQAQAYRKAAVALLKHSYANLPSMEEARQIEARLKRKAKATYKGMTSKTQRKVLGTTFALTQAVINQEVVFIWYFD